MDSIPTEASGTTFRFSALSGEVVGTEQRSDSYTTGSSRTVVIDGTGGGGGHVSTSVVVSRDIWLRDAAGDEHHVRVQADLPIRTGQRIAILHLQATRPSTKRKIDSLVSVYTPSTDTYWKVQELEDVAQTLSMPMWPQAAFFCLVALWGVSLFLCLAGVGIPIVITLAVVWWKRVKKHKQEAAAILDALRANHQAVIRHEYASWRQDADRLRKPNQATTRTIGAAE